MTKEKFEEICKSSSGPLSIAIPSKDVWAMFPGRPTDSVDVEFRKALFEVSGEMFNPNGSTRDDKLMTFCRAHRLSFRTINDCHVFYRDLPPANIEQVMKEVERDGCQPTTS